MSWYCLTCTYGPIECSLENCTVCSILRKPYQCGTGNGHLFELLSDAANTARESLKFLKEHNNLSNSEPGILSAVEQLKRAKLIAFDISINNTSELTTSIKKMIDITEFFVNAAENALLSNTNYMRQTIMKRAKNIRKKASSTVLQGGKRKNKSKKNRRGSRKNRRD